MSTRVTEANCPNKAAHTPMPNGYREFHEWAERKQSTHRQVQCEGCNLWVIWVPKVEAARRRRGA